MKSLIVFYSLEGNTRFIAQELAEKLTADVLELKPVKAYPTGKISKFVWGGKSAVMEETPELVPFNDDFAQYDTVIFGSPVWVSTFAPPLRTFMKNHSFSDKKVAAFVCCGGGRTDKAFAEFEKNLGGKKLAASQSFVDPVEGRDVNSAQKISDFVSAVQS